MGKQFISINKKLWEQQEQQEQFVNNKFKVYLL